MRQAELPTRARHDVDSARSVEFYQRRIYTHAALVTPSV